MRMSISAAAWLSMSMLAAAPVWAQVDPADRDKASTEEGDQAQNELSEVLVTATKRAESIHDVPMSVTAIASEEIERRGLVSAEDYLRGIPGVNQSSELNGKSIIIRGIETTGCCHNNVSGATTATYFGETPTTTSAGMSGGAGVDIKLVDIQRVEVLRGPQGTAFGSSALGGAVRIIPMPPRLDRFEGRVAANFSTTSSAGGDNHMIQGAVNIPLIRDKLAVRATAYRFEESGFYRNVSGSDPTYVARAASFGAAQFATDADEIGTSEFIGGRIAALFQATDNLRFTLTHLSQRTDVDGMAVATRGTYDQALLRVAPQHVVGGHEHGMNGTNINLTNLVMEYDLGWGDLVASLSNIRSGADYSLAIGGLTNEAAMPYSLWFPSEHRERVGEIRLVTRLSGALDFIAGVYAEEVDDDGDLTIIWYGSPQTNIFGTPGPFVTGSSPDRNLQQKAAFGEVAWKFAPAFKLTGGLRAYDYERTSRDDPLNANLQTTATGVTRAIDDRGFSFRGNLSYEPNENLHLYLGYSEGFRLGRRTAGLNVTRCDRNGDGIVDGTTNVSMLKTGNVDSDDVETTELGLKLTLLDRRLAIDGAIYRSDWTGVPFLVRAPVAPAGCNDAYTSNAGGALVEGIELQTQFSITDAVRLNVGGSRMKAVLTEDAPADGARKGGRLVNSPKVNANLGLQYDFRIAGHEAFVRADSIYVGSYYGNIRQSADSTAGDYVKVDASARIAFEDLSVGVFIQNATNEDDRSYRFGDNTGDYRMRPRTVGVQLSYYF